MDSSNLIMEWLQNPRNTDEYGYVPVKKDDLYSYMKNEHNIDKEEVNCILNRFVYESKIYYVGGNKNPIEFNYICLLF